MTEPIQTPDDEFIEPLDDVTSRPGISGSGILVGLIVGLLLGLLYSWQIDPIVVRNTAPADLSVEDQQYFVIAVAQEYAATQNLELAVRRLLELAPDQNPFQYAANMTCDLIRSGQVTSAGDIAVIQTLRTVYEPQGFTGDCNTSAFNTPVPVTIVLPTPTATFTPSITPVATKTATPPLNPGQVNTPIPTGTVPVRDDATFREAFVEPYCDPSSSGLIEIYVRDTTSAGLPGMPVEVSWGNRQRQVFYTGLKPERGDDYADFQMEEGETYRVAVLNESQPSRPLEAVVCDDVGTIASYRVVLQRFFNP